MNSLGEVEFLFVLLRILFRFWLELCSSFYISVSEDEVVETIDSLALIFGGMKLGGFKTDCVLRAAGVLEVRLV